MLIVPLSILLTINWQIASGMSVQFFFLSFLSFFKFF